MSQVGNAVTAPSTHTLANGLGWFSIGLGLLEIMAPGRLSQYLGMRRSQTLLQTYGLREVIAGLGILASGRPTPWLWARAAGDVIDMATVAPQLGSEDESVRRANGFAALAIGAIAALDVYCAIKLAQQ
ncbi:hypothetical protein [Methylocystis parvus]|uniref:hypothetical protein n=1 Tax=Methylocystis parvus TaxID=134 RepID=UPI003C746EAC